MSEPSVSKPPSAAPDSDPRVAALARIDALLADETVNLVPMAESVVADAALLDELQFAVLCKRLARRLNLRVNQLEAFVGQYHARAEEQKKIDDLGIRRPEPWGEAVDGATLLDETSRLFTRYVVFQRETDADTLALWTLATYAVDQFDIMPYLGVTAPDRECGKTTVLKIVLQLACRAVPASNISGAAVYRVMESYRPTLLLDEFDTFSGAEKPELNGIFNAGHDRALAYVLRCVGEKSEVRKFNCFGPKAYGMIGAPTETMESRSIMIGLLRKMPTEKLSKFNLRLLRTEELEAHDRLRRQAVRWVADHSTELKTCRPDTAGLANRAEDNWEPLFTIAELVGKGWEVRARKAAKLRGVLSSEELLHCLLRDIRNIFSTRRVDQIPSALLVKDLCCQCESEWGRYDRYLPINVYHLRHLLGRVGVSPSGLSFRKQPELLPDPRKPRQRGYRLDQFTELFKRQLAGEPPEVVTVLGNPTDSLD